MSAPFDSVLLIGFGGPTAPQEIRPFLRQVVRGRNTPPERLEEVARHYEAIGGRSPYNEWTFRQAEALRARLAEEGWPLPVYVGMRNWHPFLADTIATLNRHGRRRAVGIILAPHRSSASWERYQRDVQRAIEANGIGPEVTYIHPWHTDPLFLEAMAARVAEAVSRPAGRGDWPAEVPVLFSAHSLPVSMARHSPYEAEIRASAAGIADQLGVARWRVVYQSRSGDPRVPWLEPDVKDALRALAAEGVREAVLVPVGFLCDHVEVLYDLDVEAQATARQVGLRLIRARTVGDHPAFIRLLAQRVRAVVEASVP